MKLFYVSFLLFSINSFGSSRSDYLNQRIRDSNITVRDYLIQKQITRQTINQMQNQEAEGVGIEFMSGVTIKEETVQENGLPVLKKKYTVYNRDCGNVELPEKDGIDKLTPASSVKFKFKGMNNCTVQDWRPF